MSAQVQFECFGKMVYLKGYADDDWIFSIIRDSATFYEIDLLKYMRYTLRGAVGCILDVGANIGNHSVFFGMFVADKVVSIEPNPDVFPILLDNLTRNSIDHKPYRLGIGDKQSMATIQLAREHADNVGGAQLVAANGDAASPEEAVEVVTLDSLLSDIESYADGRGVAAIKMDIEGMEPAALRGAVTLLRKHKPDLFIEIANPRQMDSVFSVIGPLGYRRVVSWAATPVWHFSHKCKLTVSRSLKLRFYAFIFKVAKSSAMRIGRRLRSYGNS